MIGPSHHFLRTRMNAQTSDNNDIRDGFGIEGPRVASVPTFLSAVKQARQALAPAGPPVL
jgi:hypothetical protein